MIPASDGLRLRRCAAAGKMNTPIINETRAKYKLFFLICGFSGKKAAVHGEKAAMLDTEKMKNQSAGALTSPDDTGIMLNV